MNNTKLKVTFSSPKYSRKEMKKAPWLRVAEGSYVFTEEHKSEADASLRALALNIQIVKIEKVGA